MEKINIVNHSELQMHLSELKTYRDIQEDEIQKSFGEIVAMLTSVSFLKKATTQDHPIEIAKSVINTVLDLVIDITLRKHSGVKGYLSAMFAEKFTSMLIDNNITNIMSGISFLFNKKIKSEQITNKILINK